MSRQEGLLKQMTMRGRDGVMVGRRAIYALLAMFVLGTGLAQDEIEREGYFEVRSASTEVIDGVHSLDARLQLILSSEALAALDNGVTLTIELQLQVIRTRRFYLDDVEAELAVRYELEYSPVSQRYIVRNLNVGDQDSFATLYSALNSLGRVQGLPVIDDAVLSANRDYRVRLRAMLNTERYPAALRVLFFWRGQWQLQSEWYEWSLER
ncbi:MAG: DUF4390 domain-containing protein [Gammaproteobacteria bacterium]|nr:DUF4390 domain-containing protein [Gammaproteobacteria bacterium]MBT8104409.1 DUF4390 domain-containing protein [Gammaproteobacteria bacterium]NNF50537.1 DUF4390 domain-containing protein [Woeseiaceae bacterium]NNK24425.1 DUF4390 domain-containing protein [Woeseiaceae bacterium]